MNRNTYYMFFLYRDVICLIDLYGREPKKKSILRICELHGYQCNKDNENVCYSRFRENVIVLIIRENDLQNLSNELKVALSYISYYFGNLFNPLELRNIVWNANKERLKFSNLYYDLDGFELKEDDAHSMIAKSSKHIIKVTHHD